MAVAPRCEDDLFAHLKKLLEQQGRPALDLERVEKAYRYAKEKHHGQYRKNLENYIVHPVEVATILAEIPVDTNTVLAALMHDVLEDTDATSPDIQDRFGEEVLHLVEGVTKLGKFNFTSKEDQQAENFRKMFLAMAQDIRVVLLKLADRLHNMRTLCFMKPEKQLKIAQETIEIFAPLANRMGMGNIRAELEDLSLQYLHPETYVEIEAELKQTQEERQTTINRMSERIKNQLGEIGIQAKVYGRVKNYYSIFKKMQSNQKSLHDVYDISALRVIVTNEKECYEVLGVVHNSFTPIPGRFKDYIAMPKSNLYQSLHTTVIGPTGRPLEVQIRTQDMHRIAEYGIAAHWRYKESGSVSPKNEEESKLSWLRQMLEMKDETGNAKEYVDSIKLEVFQDDVFVFTPKGRVVDLPRGSTPVDFAYRIHTEVGHTCSGAMVNSKIVPLNHVLKNGDIVEVLTNKKASPRLDWIKFVQTQHAKARIRQWYKRNYREFHEQNGRQLLEAELTRATTDELMKSGKLLEIARDLNYVSLEDMLVALGYGEINLPRVVNRVKKLTEPASEPLKEALARIPLVSAKQSTSNPNKTSNNIAGLKGMMYNLAKCCMPVPGEPIVAVVTRSRGVMVHREECTNLDQANPERRMAVSWDAGENGYGKKTTHSVTLEIHVMDRVGVFKDVLAQIADANTNLTNARIKRFQADQTVVIEVTADIENLGHLERVKNAIKKLDDVFTVKRLDFRPSS